MQRRRHVLAIDLGTSGPKVALVDDTGRMRHLKFPCPEVYARTAWPLEPMDYLTLQLSGLLRDLEVRVSAKAHGTPTTSTGTQPGFCPSCPKLLSPQHVTAPADRRAQEW